MLQGLFAWLRAGARNAVVEGVKDALAEITTAKVEAEQKPVLSLTYRSVEGRNKKGS